MKKIEKIQFRMSELREELSLSVAEITGERKKEVKSELRDLEKGLRAEITSQSQKALEKEEILEKEFRGVSLKKFMDVELRNKPLEGREKELFSEMELNHGDIPLQALLGNEDVEKRTDVPTNLTTGEGKTQKNIAGRIFEKSVASYFGSHDAIRLYRRCKISGYNRRCGWSGQGKKYHTGFGSGILNGR